MNLLSKHKITGIITVLSGILALICLLLAAAGVNYHMEVFSEPSLILTIPGVNAQASKWSMIADMFGYYLLLLPVIYYLHEWMRDKTAWSSLITFCGLAYVITGAIGASILAVVYPYAINAYAAALPGVQPLIKANFELVNNMVYGGLWNLLEVLFAATWWIFTGWLLYNTGRKLTGAFTVLAGCFPLLDAIAAMAGSEPLHEVALNGYLYLAIGWAAWIGIIIYRRPLGKAVFDHAGNTAV